MTGKEPDEREGSKMQGKIEAVKLVTVADEDPDTSYLEQEGWEDRRAAYERGEFGFLGVYAEAELSIAGTVQTVGSPGLWGIESDSEQAHFDDIESEELTMLGEILREMGFVSEYVAEALTEVGQ